MAYEYENEISSLIIDNPSEIDGYAYDEIKEVYRKAKAFDEVLELHSQHIDKSSIYGNDLPLSANKYEYYDDGLFSYEMYTLIKTYLEDE